MLTIWRLSRVMLVAVFLLTIAAVHSQGQTSEKPAKTWVSNHASFAAIDKHALKAPADAEETVAKLAAYLAKPAKNDAEKARAFYRWITDRVAFSPELLFSGKWEVPPPEKVLKTRLCICGGYVQLFKALCDEAGVECLVIPGYVKVSGLKLDANMPKNHGWNSVKLDGRWYLVDATWGAGDIDPQTRKWQKVFRDYYFLTPAHNLIFTHFPENAAHQQIQPPLTAVQYQQVAQVPVEFLLYGFGPKDIAPKVFAPGFRGFPNMFWDGKFPLKIIEAPLDRHLKQGQTYRFKFEAGGCAKMGASVNGIGQEMRKQGQVFELSVMAAQGKLQIGAQFPSKGTGYFAFLEYDVE